MVESGTDSRRNSFHDQIRLGAGGKGKGEREGRRKGPSRNGSRRSSVSVQRKEEEQEPNASGNVGGPKGDSAFGGLDQGTAAFFEATDTLCKTYGACLIADEVQAGFGRSGQFFAFQKNACNRILQEFSGCLRFLLNI